MVKTLCKFVFVGPSNLKLHFAGQVVEPSVASLSLGNFATQHGDVIQGFPCAHIIRPRPLKQPYNREQPTHNFPGKKPSETSI